MVGENVSDRVARGLVFGGFSEGDGSGVDAGEGSLVDLQVTLERSFGVPSARK